MRRDDLRAGRGPAFRRTSGLTPAGPARRAASGPSRDPGEGAVTGRAIANGLPIALVMAALLLGTPLRADELRGTVTDSLGQAIPNADFDVFDLEGVKLAASDNTDAAGRYRLTLDPGRYDVLVEPVIGSGFAPRRVRGVDVAGVTVLDWQLGRAFRQVGRTLDWARRPVVATRIEFERLADGLRVPSLGNTSSPFGTFAAYVEHGEFVVTATPPESTGLAPARVSPWTIPGPDTLDFVLVPASRFAGTVRDESGAPVANVRLAFDRVADGARVPAAENRTVADGTFRTRVEPGHYDVLVIPPRGGTVGARRLAGVDLSADVARDVTLETGVRVGGQVTDARGRPLSGADWDAALEATGENVPLPGDETDADGRFALVLPAGSYRLTLTPPAGSGLDTVVLRGVAVSADTTIDWSYGSGGPPAPPAALALAPLGNPTRVPARIRFGLPEAAHVRIELFDAAGRRVRVLADGLLPAGTADIAWDGRCDDGTRAHAGVYFVRALTGARRGVTRLVLLPDAAVF